MTAESEGFMTDNTTLFTLYYVNNYLCIIILGLCHSHTLFVINGWMDLQEDKKEKKSKNEVYLRVHSHKTCLFLQQAWTHF